MTGLFTGRDRGAVQLRECLWKLAEPVCQCMPFDDLCTNAEQDALGARLLILLRNGEQCLFERQAGLG